MSAPTTLTPALVLPPSPDLNRLKRQADELLQLARAGDAAAALRLKRQLPRLDDAVAAQHADALHAVAREYGFLSWPKLKRHVESLARGDDETLRRSFRGLVNSNNAAGLRALLKQEPAARSLVNAPIFAFDGRPAAAAKRKPEVLRVLLDFGADLNLKSAWWAGGWGILEDVDNETADRLIALGAELDIFAAVHLGRAYAVRALLENDPSLISARGGDGCTPLHYAKDMETIDLLVSRGADVDALDVDHHGTPAQWNVEREAVVRRLLMHGATPDIFLAVRLGDIELIRQLIEQDPGVLNERTNHDRYGQRPPASYHIYTWTLGENLRPVQVAEKFNQREAVEFLLSRSPAEVRLLTACARGDAAEARRLLAAEPDLVARLSPEDQRQLPAAAWSGELQAVRVMLELGFDPLAQGQDGGTALHCAAWSGHAGLVELILHHPRVRELINVLDPTHNSTPLGWCCHGSSICRNPRGDYVRVAKLLKAAGGQPSHNLPDATPEVRAVIK